jgi:hypothetical protein
MLRRVPHQPTEWHIVGQRNSHQIKKKFAVVNGVDDSNRVTLSKKKQSSSARGNTNKRIELEKRTNFGVVHPKWLLRQDWRICGHNAFHLEL